VQESITALGLNYRLMTQFTSFVAVEEMTITDGGQPRRVDVPVEMPEGVSHKGVFGEDDKAERKVAEYGRNYASPSMSVNQPAPSAPKVAYDSLGGGGGGSNNRSSGSATKVRRAEAPKPTEVPKDKNPGKVDEDGRSMRLSAQEQKEQQMRAKLHPSLAALVERLKQKNSTPTADEAKFVRNGKAEIQIWLTDKSEQTLAQLKRLGFEVVLDPKTAKMVIGRLAVEKLAMLAELSVVRYIAPTN
jgi:Ca-activated chloride channel family protein